MATKHIPLNEIVDNPFQPRTEFDPEALRSLADEIKAEGFWAGSLQGRRTKDGKIELVFGHRRLRALRLLKTETVAIDIVDLTDAQMALRSLEENLQREGLTELEKADGVNRAVEIEEADLEANKKSKSHAIPQVAKRLGYSPQYVAELCKISSDTSEKIRARVQAEHLSAVTAHRAKEWGGETYALTLAKQGKQAKDDRSIQPPSAQTVTAMRKVVKQAPEAVQEKLKEAIWTGEVTTPKEAEQKGRRMASERAKRNKGTPQDLEGYVVGWENRFNDWTELVNQLAPYLEFLDDLPPIILKRFLAAQSKFLTAIEILRDIEPAAPRAAGKGQTAKAKGPRQLSA